MFQILETIFNILLLIEQINAELIIFPFKTTNLKVNSSYDFMSKLYSNEIYTTIKLGSSDIKNIQAIINTEEIAFSMNEISYNIKNSSNFNESTFPKPRSFAWENINGILFEDLLFVNSTNGKGDNIFKEEKIESKFIYVENQTSNYIGLNFPDLYEHNVISIFKALKDNKLIDNYQWCPKLNKNNTRNNKYIDFFNINGELVIGGNCNDYLPKKFEKQYITELEMLTHGQYVEYSFKFEKIYIGDDPSKNNNLFYNQVFFGLNFLTIGSIEYETKIANLFFNIWIEKNICFLKTMNIYPDIHYYYCDITYDKKKEFNINLFPKLYLEISNITFCFEYNDLFIEDPNNKNILYFIVAFTKFDPSDEYEFWKYFHFGFQFLEKYQLSFDPKAKKIYYFGFKEEIINKKNDKKINKIILYVIIIVVLCIILVVLGMLLQKKLTKIPRKIRANELNDDDFLYDQKGE